MTNTSRPQSIRAFSAMRWRRIAASLFVFSITNGGASALGRPFCYWNRIKSCGGVACGDANAR